MSEREKVRVSESESERKGVLFNLFISYGKSREMQVQRLLEANDLHLLFHVIRIIPDRKCHIFIAG